MKLPAGYGTEEGDRDKVQYENKRNKRSDKVNARRKNKKDATAKDWILRKKSLYRQRGKEGVPNDSKYVFSSFSLHYRASVVSHRFFQTFDSDVVCLLFVQVHWPQAKSAILKNHPCKHHAAGGKQSSETIEGWLLSLLHMHILSDTRGFQKNQAYVANPSFNTHMLGAVFSGRPLFPSF